MIKKNVISNRFIGIVIGNGSECAGGMQLTPDANAEDGYFDVLLIYNMPILRRLISMGKVYSGDHIRLNNFKIVRCKTISIASEPIFRFEADGEMIGKTPFTIEIVEQSIKTLLPAK